MKEAGIQGSPKMSDDGYLIVVPESATMTEVDLATDADIIITSSPAVLMGIYVNVVLSNQAVNVKNGAAIKLILPAQMAAGTKIDCHSASFSESIIIASDNAATGKIVVFWRAA
jgi:hypothetical protein